MKEWWQASLFGNGFEDRLDEHDLIDKMPVADHVLAQDFDNHFPVAPVVHCIKSPEVLVAAHRRLANVFKHSHLI